MKSKDSILAQYDMALFSEDKVLLVESKSVLRDKDFEQFRRHVDVAVDKWPDKEIRYAIYSLLEVTNNERLRKIKKEGYYLMDRFGKIKIEGSELSKKTEKSLKSSISK